MSLPIRDIYCQLGCKVLSDRLHDEFKGHPLYSDLCILLNTCTMLLATADTILNAMGITPKIFMDNYQHSVKILHGEIPNESPN